MDLTDSIPELPADSFNFDDGNGGDSNQKPERMGARMFRGNERKP